MASGSASADGVAPAASDTHLAKKRDAVRILFILDRAGTVAGADAPAEAVKMIAAEKRLQALDFWVRNPDYLAHELLDQYEDTGNKQLLKHAHQVMAGDEPEVRRLGMLRFLFGAWEALDDAIATLSLLGLASMRREYNASGTKIERTSFFLTADGAAKAAELAKIEPLNWYSERAALVALVAGDRTGSALKKCQYDIAAYHDARYGRIIEPIGDQVTARLQALKAQK